MISPSEGNNRKPGGAGGMNKKFNNDRRGPGMGVQGGRMMQDRKRKWEGGNDDNEAKRSTTGLNSRFSADSRGYQPKPAPAYGTGGYNQAPKPYGSYNRDASATGGYQQRSYGKPAGTGYEHKSLTATPAPAMQMAYQPAYSGYQAVSFAQYPPMTFAFPPPSSAMPPLPKN